MPGINKICCNYTKEDILWFVIMNEFCKRFPCFYWVGIGGNIRMFFVLVYHEAEYTVQPDAVKLSWRIYGSISIHRQVVIQMTINQSLFNLDYSVAKRFPVDQLWSTFRLVITVSQKIYFTGINDEGLNLHDCDIDAEDNVHWKIKIFFYLWIS